MNADQTNGAGAYKADRKDDAVVQARGSEPPFHLRLAKDRDAGFGYREAAVAAGALGLGVLAFKGVSALMSRRTAIVRTGHLEPVPLAGTVRPGVKDNAAPRFMGEGAEASGTSFAATAPSADLSARTPEHAPTDLMGDQPPAANDRAIDAFRPDATAPVPEEMRDSLRPATGPAPSLAANRGTFAQGLSQTDGSK